MRTLPRKIVIVALALAAAFLIFIAGDAYGPHGRVPQTAVQATGTYSNPSLGFSIDKQPAGYIADQDASGTVTFTDQVGNPWIYDVKKEAVSYASVKDWLAAQKKGSPKSAGYEPVLWTGDDTLFVAEYVAVDSDAKSGYVAYGKLMEMVHIENGELYTIHYRDWVKPEDPLRIDKETWDAITSFHS